MDGEAMKLKASQLVRKGDKVVVTGIVKNICTDGTIDVILEEDGRTLFNLNEESVGIIVEEEFE